MTHRVPEVEGFKGAGLSRWDQPGRVFLVLLPAKLQNTACSLHLGQARKRFLDVTRLGYYDVTARLILLMICLVIYYLLYDVCY